MRGLVLCLALAAALTLSLGVGGAAAHKKTFTPRAVIDDITRHGWVARPAQATGPIVLGTILTVEGRVKSRQGKCKKRRRVELQAMGIDQQRRGPGASAESADPIYEAVTTRTDRSGRFVAMFGMIDPPAIATTSTPGMIAAAIEPRRFGHGKQHRCRGYEDAVQAG